MESEQERLQEILAQAVERKDPAARRAYLDEVCGTNEALRAELESLVNAYEEEGEVVEAMLAVSGLAQEGVGTKVGRYRVLQEIGAGGFGQVFMAEQLEPVQRCVALKIIKAGMDTREVIARFEAERQALALMDHPNIARVLDAGATESGRPYFVMELVNGIKITDYCDQKGLSTKARLKLFIKVCQAVRHAHQKGIIHRDLKPSNVLVTEADGEATPKVIDFGIAKATGQRLTDKTIFTRGGQLVGTPAYMSPEQAEMNGVDVDIRSDVYSLGVLLYELLTGATPFDTQATRPAALDECRRLIRETDPPKPSTRLRTLGVKLTDVARHRQAEPATLAGLVQGDLDWIVMKALEKDRDRRYATADALLEDIQRHLEHHPVHAGPPGAGYRTRKFIRRHRAGVALMATVTAVLVAALVVSSLGFAKARRQRDRARMAEVDAEQQRTRAETALARSHELLWAANFQRARALRASGMPGQRVQALAAIQAAAAVRPSTELRTEAIAALALADLEDVGLWHELPNLPLRPVAVDGQCAQFAFATREGGVEVRSLLDNTLKGRLTNAPADSVALHFDRAGFRLAIEGADRSLVWDVSNQKVLLEEPTRSCLAITENGRYVLRLVPPTNTVIWDLDGNCEAGRLSTGEQPQRAAFSPDGQRVVLLARGLAEVWRWPGKHREAELRLPSGSVGLDWSSDGTALAIGCDDENLYVWQPPANQAKKLVGHRHQGVKPYYHPSGELIASAAWDNTLRLWDPAAGKEWLRSSLGAPLGFSADGQWLAVRRSRTVGRVRVHRAEVCRFLSTGTAASEPLRSLAFSPDSQVLAGLQPGQLMIWDLASRGLLSRRPFQGGTGLQFLGQTRLLTAGAIGLQAWTNAGSASGWELSAPVTVVQPRGRIKYCALSGDYRQLILALEQDGEVYDLPQVHVPGPDRKLFHSVDDALLAAAPLATPRVRLMGQPGFHSVAIAPDGQWIASGYWGIDWQVLDTGMWFWSSANGRPIHRIKLDGCAPYFSPDGRWFLAMTALECRLYAIHGPPNQWREVWRKPRESVVHFMSTVAFSSDGNTVALPISQNEVQVVTSATGRELVRLTLPDQWLWALAWSPDGRWLAANSRSGTVLCDLRLLHTRLSEIGLDWQQ